MAQLKPIVENSFTAYAGAVLQSRALVDVRDCLKPSARQIFYCLETDKFTHDKPFKKTLKAIGSAMRMYIHGDSSCEGVIMRAGQPFAMRYPLVEVEGSYGNLMSSGNWSAPRYTASRLSNIADSLFEDIKKDTIPEWYDNYDDTEKYPSVLPSKGFYNIVNGVFGIGVGAASSIPQFNLKEVNEALIKLLWDPNISFDEIYCAPDFATGAILLNESEVKESLKNGYGFACKLRANIEYDSSTKCLIVTEVPYSVYTNTICGELEKICDSEDNPGIDRFNDLTGESCCIKIYLAKRANPDRVLRYLYKNTSLQYHYGINMTMLKDGHYPQVFGWKQALQEYLNHEADVYRRGFEFDIAKIEHRLHIIAGLMICLANIEEVVQTIKNASTTTQAAKQLQEKFLLDSDQTKAILDMKLSRLAHLEVQKLEKEQEDLEVELAHLNSILQDEVLFKKEIEKGLLTIATKFGDARRTKILDIEGEDEEIVEQKNVQISLTNKNNLLVSEVSSLYTQRRGGAGAKFKMAKDEFITNTVSGINTDILLLFTNTGNSYHYPIQSLPLEEKIAIESIIKITDIEKVYALATSNKNDTARNIIFFTKKGLIKKSNLSEYSSTRKGSLKAILLDNDDEIVSVEIMNEEPIGMLTAQGQFVISETKLINSLGRLAKGRKGIKLNEGDYLVSAKKITNTGLYVTSITKRGYVKRTSLDEFTHTALNTKGVKLQKFKEQDDYMMDFIITSNEAALIAIASKAQIKVDMSEIPLLAKGTVGNRLIKLHENERIIGISKI